MKVCMVRKYSAVALPKNLALNKTTSQIDDYRSDRPAEKSVDGNKNTVMSAKSCSCTSSKKNAWWAVDLEKIYIIQKVAITNMKDFGK